MQVKVNDQFVNCDFEITGETLSHHTGKQIRKGIIKLWFYNEGDYIFFNKFLANEKEIILCNENIQTAWIKGNNSSNFTVGKNNYSYSIEVEEKEVLNIENLEIDNEEFSVENYFERVSNNSIIIEAIIKLKGQDSIEKFRKNMLENKPYFDVIRHGIEEKTLKMRFGKIYDWCIGPSPDEIYQAFNLVEDRYDENIKRISFEIDMQDRLKIENIILKEQMKFLFNKLSIAKILGDDEIDSFNSQLQDNIEMYLFDYAKYNSIQDLNRNLEES